MSKSTTHNDIIDLLPAYALGMLETDESTAVFHHLNACAACRQEVASYQTIADALPLAAAEMEPSPALKGQLMARIGAKTEKKTAVSPSIIARLRTFFTAPHYRPAMAFAVILLLAAAAYLWQQTGTASLQQIDLVATDAAPDAYGIIEIADAGAMGTLAVNGLPPLPADEQYQLWLIVDGQRDSGAIFSVADDGTATVVVDGKRPLINYAAFGITIEPAGGSPAPTGQRVLGHNL